MHLNGWRRLAVALCYAWLLGVASLATYEALGHRDGYFVGLSLPVGTIVAGNKATLPGGRIVDLNISISGVPVKPWEIKWDNEPEVPTEPFIRWSRLLLLGLILPLGLWLCGEALALVCHWIVRGFHGKNAP